MRRLSTRLKRQGLGPGEGGAGAPPPSRASSPIFFQSSSTISTRRILCQRRLVFLHPADHRLGYMPLEEELDDLLRLPADHPVEEHVVSRGSPVLA
jgi:hypothetical protein